MTLSPLMTDYPFFYRGLLSSPFLRNSFGYGPESMSVCVKRILSVALGTRRSIGEFRHSRFGPRAVNIVRTGERTCAKLRTNFSIEKIVREFFGIRFGFSRFSLVVGQGFPEPLVEIK